MRVALQTRAKPSSEPHPLSVHGEGAQETHRAVIGEPGVRFFCMRDPSRMGSSLTKTELLPPLQTW